MAPHLVKVFHGAVARYESVDPDDGLTAWTVHAYTRGQCVSLAVALHDLTGWPIALVCSVHPTVTTRLTPVDDLGYADTRTLTDPYVNGVNGRGFAPDVPPADLPELLARRHFRHAVVISPDGPVDVNGLFTWGAYGLPDGQDPAPCACPRGCACPLPCCLDASGLFVVRTTRDIATRLDQRTRFTGLRRADAAAATAQNWDAGVDVARLVLAALPARLTRSPRVARPATATAEGRGR